MSEVPVSPVQFSRPELKIDSAAINNEPVELDGTPTSQDKIKTLSNSIAKPLLLSDQQTIGPGSKRLTDAELKVNSQRLSLKPLCMNLHRSWAQSVSNSFSLIRIHPCRKWQSSYPLERQTRQSWLTSRRRPKQRNLPLLAPLVRAHHCRSLGLIHGPFCSLKTNKYVQKLLCLHIPDRCLYFPDAASLAHKTK